MIYPGDHTYNSTNDVYRAINFLHTKNIRVQRPITSLLTDHLHDPAYRQQVINGWLEDLTSYCYDGLSFDVEGPMFTNQTKDNYALLVEETKVAIRKLDPHLEMSMAVPFTSEPLGCIRIG